MIHTEYILNIHHVRQNNRKNEEYCPQKEQETRPSPNGNLKSSDIIISLQTNVQKARFHEKSIVDNY